MITVQSNAFEVRRSLEAMLVSLADTDKVLNRATFDSFALIKQRIQQRGEKTDGSQIGKYKGSKANPIKTKAGRTITSIAGYAKLRQKLGRQIDYIDFTLTGDMLDRSFSVIQIDENTIAIGFLNDANADKARWLEQRFGEVFANSEKELNEFIDTVVEEIEQIIRKA